MKEIILKYKKQLTFIFFLLVLYFLYFYNIGTYSLLDVDETRYVDMAKKMFENKEFFTLYLNGEYFFEKPPLFFWIENISFFVFRNISEFTARIPIAIQAVLTVSCVYFVSSKVISKKFGILAAMILATSLEFIILSKIAILDMLLTGCIILSAFSGFMTFFVNNKNKKYFWWLFYIFSALGVLSKGIPGIVIPFGIMFFAGLYTKKIKEYFKPEYFWPGLILFLLIVLPWHISMLKIHGALFYDEYIIKHHIMRFLGSEVINRERPLYFYFLTLLWGFFPWIASFISLLFEKYKAFKYVPFEALNVQRQFVALNIIGALFTIIFFSASGTKLITYILPIYAFLAVILANYWNEKKMSDIFKITALLLNFLIFSIGVGACFIKQFLSPMLYNDVAELKWIAILLFIPAGCLGIVFAITNKKFKLFITYSVFMVLLTGIASNHFFNIDYKFGQQDLIQFAQIANKHNKNIIAYNTGKRYSLLYYSDSDFVKFIYPDEKVELKNYLNKNYLIIVRNKDLEKINTILDFKISHKGRKYSVIEHIEHR